MKSFLLILIIALYIFISGGFFLHTSSQPVVLGKYSLKYSILLLVLITLPCIVYLIVRATRKKTTIIFKKKNYFITSGTKNTIIFLCLMTLILGISEIILRNKYKDYESSTYQYTLNNFDPFLQFKVTNNYAPPINSYGFRGEEITKYKPKNTYRIFILGGSTVLSRGSKFENTAARILEKKLAKNYPNKKIEVLNAGVDGYTSEHSLIQYLFKIKDFNPDMVIMWHGINDWYYSCTPPDKTYGNFNSDYSHFLSADTSMAKDHFRPQPILSLKIITIDFISNFIRDNWYSDLLNLYTKYQPFEGIYTKITQSKQYEMEQYPSLTSYERNLQSLAHITKSDNVVLVLGNQPVLYKDKMSKDELSHINFPALNCVKNGKYPSLKSTSRAMQRFNNAAKNVADTNNILFVDLNSGVPKTLEYFTDDVHYTDKGNQIIAEILYKSIISTDSIKPK